LLPSPYEELVEVVAQLQSPVAVFESKNPTLSLEPAGVVAGYSPKYWFGELVLFELCQ
jgi:hypothetical protein